MHFVCCFAALLVLTGTALGEEPPSQVRELLDRCHEARINAIEVTEKLVEVGVERLRQAKNAVINRSGKEGTFASTNARDEHIAELKKDLLFNYRYLVRLRVGGALIVPGINPMLPIGSVGALTGGVVVAQIIDDSNALVAVGARDPQTNEHHVHKVWLKGFPTAGWIDDQYIKKEDTWDWVVRVVSNKTYTTTNSGSSTLLLLERFDMSDANRFFKPSSLPAFTERVWADSAEKYTVAATVVGFRAGKVSLRKPDGKVVSLVPSQLCKADQEYLKSIAIPRLKAREATARELKDVPEFRTLQATLAKLEGNETA